MCLQSLARGEIRADTHTVYKYGILKLRGRSHGREVSFYTDHIITTTAIDNIISCFPTTKILPTVLSSGLVSVSQLKPFDNCTPGQRSMCKLSRVRSKWTTYSGTKTPEKKGSGEVIKVNGVMQTYKEIAPVHLHIAEQ